MAQARRVALVTGAGSGMGRATAARLARAGMAVGVLDIDGSAAAAVVEEIRREGGDAIALSADISDRAGVAAAVRGLVDAFGPVTVLVNNAAVEDFSPFLEIDDDRWDRVMGVNLKGTYIVTQLVVPHMVAEGWGRIINVTAFGAQLGAPNMALYTASKGGLISMTRSLAIELGPRGITVNSVSPGFIDTPMARRAIDDDLFPVPYQQIVATYPIQRLGLPEEIAGACAFLASDEAAYVTGQGLGVNGGAAM